eukprot:TRINITY_DN7671_c0_g1_i2.p2 TRINITY_DN7671_c0_g1~~TRINITY_DN7671_c0_g1_i2.p2  ORF type:complete len:374 (-),score=72.36 TRINITY_DN7671_c0_g1_i2:214-1335(-)
MDPAVVIDIGGALGKAGFAGDELPRCVFPSRVARPVQPMFGASTTGYRSYCGHEAEALSASALVKDVVHRGSPTSWDDLEALWAHAFKLLGVSPDEQSVLVSEAPVTSRPNREKLCQIMFDAFDIAAFYLGNHAVLALNSVGKSSGMLVECGDGMSYAVPVRNSIVQTGAVQRLELAGRDVTGCIFGRLVDNNPSLPGLTRSICSKIKELRARVALDYPTELASEAQETYELPDGSALNVGSERIEAPEILFQPALAAVNGVGLSDMVINAIGKCNAALQPDLFSNIVLSGGSALLPGLPERLRRDLQQRVPQQAVAVDVAPQAQFAAWRGGSMLASMPAFEDRWISRADYDEIGPSCVHQRCVVRLASEQLG